MIKITTPSLAEKLFLCGLAAFAAIGVFIVAAHFYSFFRLVTNDDRQALNQPVLDRTKWNLVKTYDTAIEHALQALQRVRPAQHRYARSLGFPICVLNGAAFQSRYPLHSHAKAMTESNRGIFINGEESSTASLLTAAISHELVHLQHRDSTAASFRHSRIYHLLWMSEEDEAHMTGFDTLRYLGRSDLAIEKECIDLLFRPRHGLFTICYSFGFLYLLAFATSARFGGVATKTTPR